MFDIAAYCNKDDNEILNDIQEWKVPREVLKDREGWKRICQVRGRKPGRIDPELWRDLCSRRGDLGVPSGPYE